MNIKNRTVPIFFLSFSLLFFSQTAQAAEFDHSHALFDKVLKRFVKNGLVDYTGLKANAADLNQYLAGLEAVTQADFDPWSRERQIAYLTNHYNARTLQLIVDNYPVKSIKNIGNVLKGPWDQPVVRLFGQASTLNTIEHKMLRKNYEEPRLHFALVCAARGCPPLRSEAYTADRLEIQLEDQGRIFIGTPQKNSVNTKDKTVALSPIFKWFQGDFTKKSGSVLSFVQPYFPPEAAAGLAEGNYKVRYTFYDWSLNDSKNS